MDKSETIANLAAALVKAQKAMPLLERTATGQVGTRSYHYVPLDVAMPAALKVLTAHGLGISQLVSHNEHGGVLTTMLLHESGEYIAADQPLYLEQDTPQKQGSAVTYARRYGLMAAIGMVADEDDDASAITPRQGSGKAPATSGDPKKAAPALSDWSTQAAPQSYPSTCFVCGASMAKGLEVFYRKRADGKYDRKHGYDCEYQDAPPLPVEAAP